MKSATLKAATTPLHTLEREAIQAASKENEDHELELSRAQTQLSKLEKCFNDGKAPKGATVPTIDEVKAGRREVQRLENAKPIERTYKTSNTTHEALSLLLQTNPKGITVERDELAPFITNMNREENAEARGFFNAAWDGTLGFSFHRVSREKVRLERVCVALCGMMQPKLLDELIARMLAEPMQNDGFLQRFQLLVYPDSYPEWTPPEQQEAVNQNALENSVKVFKQLDALERYDSSGNLEPRLLRFSSEAQAEFNAWHDALECCIRPGGGLETDTAFKSWYAKTKSLCVSLAAIFHLCNLTQTSSNWGDDLEPISFEALGMALDWCDFLTQHARKIYALELNPEHAAAHSIARLIVEGKITHGQRMREAKRSSRSVRSSVIDYGLTTLEHLGWLKVVEVQTDGRSAEEIHLHPELRNDPGGE